MLVGWAPGEDTSWLADMAFPLCRCRQRRAPPVVPPPLIRTPVPRITAPVLQPHSTPATATPTTDPSHKKSPLGLALLCIKGDTFQSQHSLGLSVLFCTAGKTLFPVHWKSRSTDGCYVATWMGREFGGEWVHVYVRLRPFAVHLKLSHS